MRAEGGIVVPSLDGPDQGYERAEHSRNHGVEHRLSGREPGDEPGARNAVNGAVQCGQSEKSVGHGLSDGGEDARRMKHMIGGQGNGNGKNDASNDGKNTSR